MLSDSEKNFRHIAENTVNFIRIYDRNLQLTYMTPNTETVLGYSFEEL